MQRQAAGSGSGGGGRSSRQVRKERRARLLCACEACVSVSVSEEKCEMDAPECVAWVCSMLWRVDRGVCQGPNQPGTRATRENTWDDGVGSRGRVCSLYYCILERWERVCAVCVPFAPR